jgi:RNA polymerase sigma-70 factor, ECF subfamily
MSSGWTAALGISRVDSQLSIADCHALTMVPANQQADDSALVLAAQEGDRSAFGGLYSRYARMVHGILLARVPLNDVDDLVQDVFLRALPRLRSLRDVTRFGPWLSAIARNIANDHFRKTKPVSAVTDSLSDEDTQEPAARNFGGVSDAEAVMILDTVRTLSDTYRETLILRLVEGMTGPEIAARTGLKPGSVRVNLHRGMQQLREKLKQASRGDALGSKAAVHEGIARDAASSTNDSLRRRNGL